MKKSGYRTTFHIYFIFLLTLIGTILSAILLFFLLITVQKPDGSYVRSDWPKSFTENFSEQILFADGTPRVAQAGIELLQDNGVGLQKDQTRSGAMESRIPLAAFIPPLPAPFKTPGKTASIYSIFP